MTYNILAIGDIHGRNDWRDIVDYYMSNNKIDRIVFLGDYVDSFDITPDEQLRNLRNLINFKIQNKDLVELLIGNHDLHYMVTDDLVDNVKCTGFNNLWYKTFHKIFNSYKDYFNISYQYKNWLFTHAGIHRGWYTFRFKDFILEGETITEALNREFKLNNPVLFDCGFRRGGREKVGGPLWADKSETIKKPLIGYHQVVGHTAIKDIKTFTKGTDTSIVYIDNQDIETDLTKKGLLIKIKNEKLWENPKIKITKKSLF